MAKATKPPAPKKPKLLDAYFDNSNPAQKNVERVTGDFHGAKVALIVEAGMSWADVRDALTKIRKQFPE